MIEDQSTVVLAVPRATKGEWVRRSRVEGRLQDWMLLKLGQVVALDSIKPVATATELEGWRQRHGFTYEHAAKALGIKRTAFYLLLNSRDELPVRAQLACYAVDVKAILKGKEDGSSGRD